MAIDPARLALVRQLRELATGRFLDGAVNVLAFGLPGVGKSHAACALGHTLVEAGHSVRFTPTYQLIQELLAAKRDLELPRFLHKLDAFELLILDDLGYVGQTAEDAEVLFTLLAERYERRSVLITSNLVFSEWERIFKNPMATAAAIEKNRKADAVIRVVSATGAPMAEAMRRVSAMAAARPFSTMLVSSRYCSGRVLVTTWNVSSA